MQWLVQANFSATAGSPLRIRSFNILTSYARRSRSAAYSINSIRRYTCLGPSTRSCPKRFAANSRAGTILVFRVTKFRPFQRASFFTGWRGCSHREAFQDTYSIRYYRGFDRAVSRWILERRPHMVIGYEGACLATFGACRKAGIICVLDAASVHFRTQRSAWPEYPQGEPWERIDRRKSDEIELADHILTLSEFARDSYVSAGVPATKVSVAALGIDPGRFAFRPRARHDGAFRFLYAGSLSRIKGVDLLLRAFDDRAMQAAELVLIGERGDGLTAMAALPRSVRLAGYLPLRELVHEYHRADVAVFPSRFDGFGQVVLEAMATGLPVIASDHVGAKDLVSPQYGWIFPSQDVGALRQCMMAALAAGSSLTRWGSRLRMRPVKDRGLSIESASRTC